MGLACPARDARPSDHWLLVLLLLIPWVREELSHFAFGTGEDPEDGIVSRMRARFRFALSSERWVEALHSFIHHSIASAHHIGPVHVAFYSAFPSMRRILADDPGSLATTIHSL